MSEKIESEKRKPVKKKKRRLYKRTRRSLTILGLLLFVIFLAGLIAYFRTGGSRVSGHGTVFFPFEASEPEAVCAPELIPEYSGEAYCILNENKPLFTAKDLKTIDKTIYSEPDLLGRCGTASAFLDRSMMKDMKREYSGNIKPTGWEQVKYPGVVDSEPAYLYNRCHLIPFKFTGVNAEERNLITGTRYMNAGAMYDFEVKVMQYLDTSENHVLYRVTPYFKDREMVCRGVEMEAYSVEDEGRGISYHVFVYNVQPGVEIDYLTGHSKLEQQESKTL